MAITRKDFVIAVTEELGKNPRAVLQGHGIQAHILQQIKDRPDIMAKLATILYSIKPAKRGAKGLRKTQGLLIKGYKNFNEFNLKAREDVEKFLGTLDEKDQELFSNKDNVVTMLMMPDNDVSEVSDNENLETDIATGKSVFLGFDKAVTKEYRIPSCSYIIVMVADSIIRPKEEKFAGVRERRNTRKENKRTIARIKAELKAKAAEKLKAIDIQARQLEISSRGLNSEVQQFIGIGQEFGVKGGNPITVVSQMKKRDHLAGMTRDTYNASMESLTADEKRLVRAAQSLVKSRKFAEAQAILDTLGKPTITAKVMGTLDTRDSSDMLKDRRRKRIARKKFLTEKNKELLDELNSATGGRRRSIQSSISRNNAEIDRINEALNVYGNISIRGMQNKARMLKEVRANIEALRAEGLSVTEALEESIAELEASPAEKSIITQEAIKQVANGADVVVAAQQAVQQVMDNPGFGSRLLTGASNTVDSIVNLLRFGSPSRTE